ncbi:MAG: ShlB/FhaC/HecB family hemolysin secretion/activation protein, partial [Cyanobacteria bacterium J083]
MFQPKNISISYLLLPSAMVLQLTSIAYAETNQPLIAQQPQPNRERFIQPDITPTPTEEETTPQLDTPATTPTRSNQQDEQVNIPVSKIEVVGSTVFTEADFAAIITPLEGKTVTLAELKAAANSITQLYIDAGYLTSRAVVVPQDIVDGTVQIRVVEGKISEIRVEGTERLSENYVRDRIELGVDTPANINEIEDRLKLLNTNDLFRSVKANLQPGTGLGESILIVTVEEDQPWILGFNVDNYNTPATGSERIGTTIGNRNVLGLGDSFFASYNFSAQGGSQILDASYTIPVNAMDGTVQLRAIIDRNQIIDDDFEFFEIEGESERYEISYRQPLVRSFRREFALSLGFAFQESRDFILGEGISFLAGADEDGEARTSVVKFGQDYLSRDTQGIWALRSQFNFGVDIFDATDNEGSLPDSQFFSWLGQIQRVQRLSRDNLLIIQAELQLTPDSLLPSEQFVIGGGLSVRGFRQNARQGDNGFRLSIEDRITIYRDQEDDSTVQIAPFLDMGSVWNSNDNPNRIPDDEFLIGLGLGLLWQPLPELNIRLDYGVPLVDIDDRGENIQDDGFYFSVNYLF